MSISSVFRRMVYGPLALVGPLHTDPTVDAQMLSALAHPVTEDLEARLQALGRDIGAEAVIDALPALDLVDPSHKTRPRIIALLLGDVVGAVERLITRDLEGFALLSDLAGALSRDEGWPDGVGVETVGWTRLLQARSAQDFFLRIAARVLPVSSGYEAWGPVMEGLGIPLMRPRIAHLVPLLEVRSLAPVSTATEADWATRCAVLRLHPDVCSARAQTVEGAGALEMVYLRAVLDPAVAVPARGPDGLHSLLRALAARPLVRNCEAYLDHVRPLLAIHRGALVEVLPGLSGVVALELLREIWTTLPVDLKVAVLGEMAERRDMALSGREVRLLLQSPVARVRELGVRLAGHLDATSRVSRSRSIGRGQWSR